MRERNIKFKLIKRARHPSPRPLPWENKKKKKRKKNSNFDAFCSLSGIIQDFGNCHVFLCIYYQRCRVPRLPRSLFPFFPFFLPPPPTSPSETPFFQIQPFRICALPTSFWDFLCPLSDIPRQVVCYVVCWTAPTTQKTCKKSICARDLPQRTLPQALSFSLHHSLQDGGFHRSNYWHRSLPGNQFAADNVGGPKKKNRNRGSIVIRADYALQLCVGYFLKHTIFLHD